MKVHLEKPASDARNLYIHEQSSFQRLDIKIREHAVVCPLLMKNHLPVVN